VITFSIAICSSLKANLFKLQLGGSRHWNVYVHSFLYFGVNGAWSRLNAMLLWDKGTKVNPCLPSNSEIAFDSWIHTEVGQHYFLPRSSPESTPYSVIMTSNHSDFQQCSDLTYKLLRCVVLLALSRHFNFTSNLRRRGVLIRLL
jgi:hypothetical protein